MNYYILYRGLNNHPIFGPALRDQHPEIAERLETEPEVWVDRALLKKLRRLPGGEILQQRKCVER